MEIPPVFSGFLTLLDRAGWLDQVPCQGPSVRGYDSHSGRHSWLDLVLAKVASSHVPPALWKGVLAPPGSGHQAQRWHPADHAIAHRKEVRK